MTDCRHYSPDIALAPFWTNQPNQLKGARRSWRFCHKELPSNLFAWCVYYICGPDPGCIQSQSHSHSHSQSQSQLQSQTVTVLVPIPDALHFVNCLSAMQVEVLKTVVGGACLMMRSAESIFQIQLLARTMAEIRLSRSENPIHCCTPRTWCNVACWPLTPEYPSTLTSISLIINDRHFLFLLAPELVLTFNDRYYRSTANQLLFSKQISVKTS